MRDPARIDMIIEQLRTTWHAAPDMRLGQLIENAAAMSGAGPIRTYNIEDDLMAYGLGRLFGMVAQDALENGEE